MIPCFVMHSLMVSLGQPSKVTTYTQILDLESTSRKPKLKQMTTISWMPVDQIDIVLGTYINAFAQIFVTPCETRIIPNSTNTKMKIRKVN